MDIEQARTFLAIAAHGSFLEAASRLHVTQSTVSARIQHLEARLALHGLRELAAEIQGACNGLSSAS